MIAPRPSLERRILDSIDAGRIPVLLGGCGSGRTSLLLRTEGRLDPGAGRYLDIAAAATTPERCLSAVLDACRAPAPVREPASPREAFDALLAFFDGAQSPAGRPMTFLLDDFLDVRTFENFPGLRQVPRDFVRRLADSPARFVMASRFTARVHRLLRDAPPRFEVVHIPPLSADEVADLARLFDGSARSSTAGAAAFIADLSAGRPGYAHLIVGAMASMGPAPDPVAALASLFAPDGRLTARCRECYELRLGRARGFGALKAILGVLAGHEPLNLTEISHALRRTPGSTKDYLSWLEDVDLVSVRSKRYVFEDPLLRVYVRLYGRPVPPTDDDVVREVGAYARRALPVPAALAASPAAPGPAPAVDRSGIIEID